MTLTKCCLIKTNMAICRRNSTCKLTHPEIYEYGKISVI